MEQNGRLVYGGHPAISPLVTLLYLEAGLRPQEHVTLYLSDLFSKHFSPGLLESAQVVVVPAVEDDREKSLLAMRQRMLSEPRLQCGVFIGGMEGVLEECSLFKQIHPGLPIYPIASTGAAAAMLYEQSNLDLPMLASELTYITLFRRLFWRQSG